MFDSHFAMDKHQNMFFIPLLLFIFLRHSKGQFLGPANIDFERLEKCGTDIMGAKLELTYHKVNRTHSGMDAIIESPFDIDDDVGVNVTASKWGDGGWKAHAFDLYESNACKFVETHAKKQLYEILKLVGLKQQCPMAKGHYEVKNHVFDTNIDVPVMYGKFMIDINFVKDGQFFTCIRLFMTSKPKMG